MHYFGAELHIVCICRRPLASPRSITFHARIDACTAAPKDPHSRGASPRTVWFACKRKEPSFLKNVAPFRIDVALIHGRIERFSERKSLCILNIPKSGSNMPKMGTKTRRPRVALAGSLADALFSTTQQRVLGLLFGQPERSYYATELIGLIAAGSGAVQRELARLERSGLVTARRLGTQKHYQANPASPVFDELCGIARKTFGLAEPLREALAPFAADIVAAFVYGSVAKREDTASSDIDLMIVSDTIAYPELYAALEQASAELGRAINPTVYSRQQLAQRLQDGNAFTRRVFEQPKLWLIGSDSALAA